MKVFRLLSYGHAEILHARLFYLNIELSLTFKPITKHTGQLCYATIHQVHYHQYLFIKLSLQMLTPVEWHWRLQFRPNVTKLHSHAGKDKKGSPLPLPHVYHTQIDAYVGKREEEEGKGVAQRRNEKEEVRVRVPLRYTRTSQLFTDLSSCIQIAFLYGWQLGSLLTDWQGARGMDKVNGRNWYR